MSVEEFKKTVARLEDWVRRCRKVTREVKEEMEEVVEEKVKEGVEAQVVEEKAEITGIGWLRLWRG